MPQVIHLILTVDYELFGNGSGGITECLLRPTEDMARLAEQYAAPLTFFVDTLELQRLEHGSKLNCAQISLVRAQLSELLHRGHDLQLHLHPQWDKAVEENGTWRVVFDDWRIGDISAGRVRYLLADGRQWLERIGKGVDAGYRCEVFRAGGWAIQPEKHVLQALRELGFTMDSTVAPGMISSAQNAWFDFRRCPSLPWWSVAGELCRVSDEGFIEVPIAVADIGRLTHLRHYYKRRSQARFPQGCLGSYQHTSGALVKVWGLLDKLRTLGRSMLDFSTLSAEHMVSIVERVRSQSQRHQGDIPLVAIAHNKTFTENSAQEFSTFMDWAKTQPYMRFSTYGQWRRTIER